MSSTAYDTPIIFPFDSPRTRKSDPVESHMAADTNNKTASEREVLSILSLYPDGLTDEQLLAIHEKGRRAAGHTPYSPSRLRTARHSLQEEGKVVKLGQGRTERGKPCGVWGTAR